MICPVCKSNLPVLSRVCPTCQTVIDKQDGAPDAIELADALDTEVIQIKKLVHEAQSLKLGGSLWLYILIAGIFIGALAAKTGAGLLWILAVAALVVAFIVFRRSRSASVADRLSDHKIAYEYGITLVNRFFRGLPEMSRFVDENAKVVSQAENAIAAGRKRSRLVGWGIALAEAVVCAIIVAAVPSREAAALKKAEMGQAFPSDYDGQIAWFINAGEPQKAINLYLKSEYNDEYVGAPKRVELCRALCQAGYTPQAEDFVLRYCIGKMQDLDCATQVAQSYLTSSDPEAAAVFVSKCTGLKYKSDVEKLKKLL